MHKGVAPIIAGTSVLVGGCILKNKLPLFGAGLIGYGIAHIVLGGAEYMQEEKVYSETCCGVPVGKIKKKIADTIL
ncbi:MAG: hypothetical protein IJE46_02610 [Clostridia bacterium]|nr:hypothetical protein [Clostridia bacterium]